MEEVGEFLVFVDFFTAFFEETLMWDFICLENFLSWLQDRFMCMKHDIARKVGYCWAFMWTLRHMVSIPVFQKTLRHGTPLHRICSKLLIDWVPVDSSQLTQVTVSLSLRRLSVHRRKNYLARFLFESSPKRLSVDRRWNYSAWVLGDSSPKHRSVNHSWNYLAQVPVVCTLTDV